MFIRLNIKHICNEPTIDNRLYNKNTTVIKICNVGCTAVYYFFGSS